MSARSNYLDYLSSQGYAANRACLFEAGSGDFVDPITSRKLAINASPGWATNSGYTCGRADHAQNDASNDHWYFYAANLIDDDPSSGFLSTTAQTVLLIRAKTDSTLRDQNTFGPIEGGPSTGFCNALIPYSNGTVYWDFGYNGFAAPNRLTWAGWTPTTDIEAWAFRGGTLGLSIWHNGVKEANSASAATRTGTASAFGINKGQTGILSGDVQDFFFFALVPEEVSDAVLATFTPTNVFDPDFYAPASSVNFRKTFSPIGGRAGARQLLNA